MNAICSFINLLFLTQFVACRDFYIGMFKQNDFLVAQDVIYKEASHFGYTTASYGRLFKCPITYFRVVDRLGMGRGPYTKVVRGGLRKKYINVRIKSTYRLPVSVNIYVGCENKMARTSTTTTKAANTSDTSSDTTGNATISTAANTGTAETNAGEITTEGTNITKTTIEETATENTHETVTEGTNNGEVTTEGNPVTQPAPEA